MNKTNGIEVSLSEMMKSLVGSDFHPLQIVLVLFLYFYQERGSGNCSCGNKYCLKTFKEISKGIISEVMKKIYFYLMTDIVRYITVAQPDYKNISLGENQLTNPENVNDKYRSKISFSSLKSESNYLVIIHVELTPIKNFNKTETYSYHPVLDLLDKENSHSFRFDIMVEITPDKLKILQKVRSDLKRKW